MTSDIASTRPRDLAYTRPFWDAVRDGTLVIQICDGCSNRYFPPRVACGKCTGTAFSWEATSGIGTVYGSSRLHRGTQDGVPPVTLALVDIDDEIRMLTVIIEADDIEIGSPVEFAGVPPAGGPDVPFVFRPVKS